MAHTINTFTFNGTQTDYDISFTGGYRTRDDVTAYKHGPVNYPVAFDWLTETKVRISTAHLVPGDRISFVRTVSKVEPPIDMMLPNNFTREAVVAAVTHTLQALQEVLDGRVDDFNGVFIDAMNKFIEQGEANVEKSTDQANLAREYAKQAGEYTEEAAYYAGQVFDPETIFAQQYRDAVKVGANYPPDVEYRSFEEVYEEAKE